MKNTNGATINKTKHILHTRTPNWIKTGNADSLAPNIMMTWNNIDNMRLQHAMWQIEKHQNTHIYNHTAKQITRQLATLRADTTSNKTTQANKLQICQRFARKPDWMLSSKGPSGPYSWQKNTPCDIWIFVLGYLNHRGDTTPQIFHPCLFFST